MNRIFGLVVCADADGIEVPIGKICTVKASGASTLAFQAFPRMDMEPPKLVRVFNITRLAYLADRAAIMIFIKTKTLLNV
jgi:hypothetical protein